jgi:hypothetical protein
VVDREMESRFDFKLSESLALARVKPLLQGLSLYFLDGIKPPKDEMALIIQAAGLSVFRRLQCCKI